jgi:hypothetical protein
MEDDQRPWNDLILELWDRGNDTVDIARLMQTSEAEVYNKLMHLRWQFKQNPFVALFGVDWYSNR